MSIAEILQIGSSVLVIGLGIVFSVLIILWIILELMRVIFAGAETKKIAAPQPQEAAAPIVTAQPETEDDALIAVITAAVAASLNTSTYHLKIRSIKRTDGGWIKAARSEQNY